MRTTLNLLTRNGAVFMDFQPALSADQYAELLRIAEASETDEDLRKTVKTWANSQKLNLRLEE